MRRHLAVVALLAFAAVAFISFAPPAGAHPLGNFTVNRYARIEVSGEIVRVYYVLDEAEIPTFQDRDELDATGKRIRSRRTDIRDGLTLTVDDTPVPLSPAQTHLTLPSGEAGLATLRLAIRFEGRAPDATGPTRRVSFTDANEPDRLGWREIVVVGRGGAAVSDSTVPARDVTDELRDYPDDRLMAPLDVRRAEFGFASAEQVSPVALTTTPAEGSGAGDGFADLLDRHDITVWALAGMLAIAFAFGAGHALAPGHGKTAMAAYLVGTRGRPVDAVLLGTIVSFMHTASVFALALVLYSVNRSTPIERVYPILTIASGAIVIGLGVYLAVKRARASKRPAPPVVVARPRERALDLSPALVVAGSYASDPLPTVPVPPADAHAHDLGHDDTHDDGHGHSHVHGHDHGHSHGFGATHTHALPDDVPPLSRRGLVLLATSGGLLPSPSAVLVLLGAFTAGRAALGLTLVAAFSVGLAVTLTAVGLLLVVGGRAAARRSLLDGRFARLLPVAGAIALTAVGVVITAQGISGL